MEFGLSIGSNLGDRAGNIDAIRDAIAALPAVTILAESPVYDTEPVDVPAEFADSPFLNGVIIVESSLPPRELAGQLKAVEARLGRTRGSNRNMPRSADIDIIYAGNLQIAAPELTVPHPQWHKRRFVVQPLADLRPDLLLPGQVLTVAGVLLTLPPTPKVVRYSGT